VASLACCCLLHRSTHHWALLLQLLLMMEKVLHLLLLLLQVCVGCLQVRIHRAQDWVSAFPQTPPAARSLAAPHTRPAGPMHLQRYPLLAPLLLSNCQEKALQRLASAAAAVPETEAT
jgi:hypothetical protein